jgi:hypothetical protein
MLILKPAGEKRDKSELHLIGGNIHQTMRLACAGVVAWIVGYRMKDRPPITTPQISVRSAPSCKYLTVHLKSHFTLVSPSTVLDDAGQMRLPWELVEDTIECLPDNRPTLETYSLIATTCLARSQRHLFSMAVSNDEGLNK